MTSFRRDAESSWRSAKRMEPRAAGGRGIGGGPRRAAAATNAAATGPTRVVIDEEAGAGIPDRDPWVTARGTGAFTEDTLSAGRRF